MDWQNRDVTAETEGEGTSSSSTGTGSGSGKLANLLKLMSELIKD